MIDALFDNRSPAAPDLKAEIAELRLLWDAGRRGHVPGPIGCSCGAPISHVTPADFERDLLDYLAARHLGHPEARRILARAIEEDSLVWLMDALESGKVPVESITRIIADLRRSLSSFALGGRRYMAKRA